MSIEKRTEVSNNGVLRKTRDIFVAPEHKDTSALRKEEIITNILSESDQLNLLAIIVEQIGDRIALSTPEYTYSKQEFAKIKQVLGTA